jgi:pimeloyl-ACP methyl ester carboxylesterase
MELLPGVSAHTTRTDRLSMHWLEYGPDDGVPVVLVQGNLSTGRFYEHVMPHAPENLRLIAPDMRGFGRTDPLPVDATRGLRDWSDDVASLLRALGITRPVHLVGWSSGGLAVSHYAMEHAATAPVASLTYIDPVPPYGYGGVRRDGTPCAPDYAGSGAAGANPELVQRLRDRDRSAASPFSIRNVINTLYWSPQFRLPAEREDLLVNEILLTVIGDGTYPGDAATSPNWPGIAPGTTGMLNALSPKYANWSGIVDLDPKPPILWTHGSADLIVADGAALELGALGAAGVVPGWPGEEAYPPQPMVSQIRDVLGRYASAGGVVQTEMFQGCGHGPLFDAEQRWCEITYGFITRAEAGLNVR